MRRPVIRSPRSRVDLRDIIVYLGRDSTRAAHRFRQAYERTIVSLASQPGIGEPYPSGDPALAGLRLCLVDRFRSYVIVYRATDDRVEVLRVLHAARDLDQVLTEDLGGG